MTPAPQKSLRFRDFQNSISVGFRRISVSGLLVLCLAWGLSSCADQSRTETKLAEDITTAQTASGSTLTLSDVTLEQANEQGQLVWRVKSAEATYSRDQKMVTVKKPEGELFQDGELVYEIEAETGEVFQNGEKIFLRGKIVARDPNHDIVLRGNELEWRPDDDLLIVRNNLVGEHDQVLATATEAKVFTRQKRMELFGQVVANVKEPVLQMRTEHLIWEMEREKMTGDRPIQIDEYENKKVVNSGFADFSEFDLKTKIAILKKNAQMISVEPPLQISSTLINWDVNKNAVDSPVPVSVLHQAEKVVLTANQGKGNLVEQIFDFQGNVVGIGQQRQAQLNSDFLTWKLKDQSFEADGNVVFRQVEPPFNLMGSKAVGQFANETVIVRGGESGHQVVTEIVP